MHGTGGSGLAQARSRRRRARATEAFKADILDILNALEPCLTQQYRFSPYLRFMYTHPVPAGHDPCMDGPLVTAIRGKVPKRLSVVQFEHPKYKLVFTKVFGM